MTDADMDDFAQLVSAQAKYYRQDMSDFLLDVWWTGCRDYALADVSSAISRHVADPDRGNFPVKVSDVVRLLEGNTADRAAEAWGKVFEAMGRVGAHQDVCFDEAAIHAAITDMGGWPKLCRWETDELSHAIHRFGELYRSYATRGAPGYERFLQGDTVNQDAQYERRGLKVPAPVLIGDPEKCAAVYAGGGTPRAPVTFLPAGSSPAALLQLPGGLSVRLLAKPEPKVEPSDGE